jgi:hypothetical protein
VLGESHRPRWKELVGQSIIARILRESAGWGTWGVVFVIVIALAAATGGRAAGLATWT